MVGPIPESPRHERCSAPRGRFSRPLGSRKEELREQARSYVRQLVAAQSAGAVVPELSPQLRGLVDTAAE
jgi:hypothetical protein